MEIYSHTLLNNFLNKYFIREKIGVSYKKFILNINLQWEKKKKKEEEKVKINLKDCKEWGA